MDIEERVSPVYHVKAVPVEKVCANNYNPNVVGSSRDEIAGAVYLGRRFHDALVYAIMTRKMTSILL